LFQAGEEKYSHLDAAEVGKVEKAITEKSEWYNKYVFQYSILQNLVPQFPQGM
jgi:hypothetical protein